MSLRLYDTGTRSVIDFQPRKPGEVGVYLCGLTVQGPPHIGHLRSGVSYDVLIRWLRRSGYNVTYVRNITDIDDKILVRGEEQGRPWWSIAYANECVLADAYAALGAEQPTYEPRATGHITQMIDLISELIERGHAYVTGAGDVWFDVSSWPAYGELSHRRPEDMLSSAETGAKRDSRDFGLWKAHKPGEPADAAWTSPWGPGRPGWHIECSAMARRYLGDGFDIHGGGTDIMFPHHENELAQSSAAGLPFAKYWVHNGMLNLAGTKMSKSLGNTLSIGALGEKGFGTAAIRYYLTGVHYRSAVDFSEDALGEARSAWERLSNFVHRAADALGTEATIGGPLVPEFTAAMDDDLNTPAAVAVIHDSAREGNAALDAGDDAAAARHAAAVRAMLDQLGLDPLDPHWDDPGDAKLHGAVDALVKLALEQRAEARARKDYAAADRIRDELSGAGITVKDTPRGPVWTVN
ncbi:cysteine--tRNA ligase [Glycomyces algeriensis]|uniref:Cysteine--tRNA ligase n=1 Tax=Glycomyces algeriensis TaxID=256037 RepID=A0A9W6LFG8_9ACTN|nr:cysteine--tRNA ligase [Glycomyces algeriensis]MDA1367747.1 cysteine--tRNA ligase [Glycomyces algeriensis]MDR7352889.1 cysteinyl-tRNA synthetase [Glycomyces algeriensis]GLI40576.1 cysteine--tRNA ligase [Glycomyces algeriensis]